MLDKLLYLYSTIFITLIVVGSVLSAERGPSSLLIGVLFAPVAFYLIFSFVKFIRTRKPTPSSRPNTALAQILKRHQSSSTSPNPTRKSARPAITSPLFIATLILLSFAVGSLLVRSIFNDTSSAEHQNILSLL